MIEGIEDHVPEGVPFHQEIILKILEWGFTSIRAEPEIIDELFARQDARTRAKIKALMQQKQNLHFGLNYPRQSMSLPSISVISGGEEPSEMFLGDIMAQVTNLQNDVPSTVQNEVGMRWRCRSQVLLAAPEADTALYLFWLAVAVLFSNKLQMEERYGIEELSISGADVQWDTRFLPTPGYAKQMTLNYFSTMSMLLRAESVVRRLSFELSAFETTEDGVSEAVIVYPPP